MNQWLGRISNCPDFPRALQIAVGVVIEAPVGRARFAFRWPPLAANAIAWMAVNDVRRTRLLPKSTQ